MDLAYYTFKGVWWVASSVYNGVFNKFNPKLLEDSNEEWYVLVSEKDFHRLANVEKILEEKIVEENIEHVDKNETIVVNNNYIC